jgi:membrane protease subunit HflK
MREIVGKSKMDYVLTRSATLPRAPSAMRQILDRYKTGISISRVTLQNIQPPGRSGRVRRRAVKATRM